MTDEQPVNNKEILCYTHKDFEIMCDACRKKLLERYKYCCRDDTFWLNSIAEMRKDAFELKAKYDKLLSFAHKVRKYKCCLECDCLSCAALDVLREIGELECQQSP